MSTGGKHAHHPQREHVAGARNEAHASFDDAAPNRRTGYYVAGHDWPAIPNNFSIGDVYAALEGISDEAVRAAKISLSVSTASSDPDRSSPAW
jgi:hypothetical protein